MTFFDTANGFQNMGNQNLFYENTKKLSKISNSVTEHPRKKCYKIDPHLNQILMGVYFMNFFDLRPLTCSKRQCAVYTIVPLKKSIFGD